MYTFHYRGYFFVQGESVSEFDSFRYLNNFYSLIPIVTSMLLSDIRKSILVYSALVLMLITSVYPTIFLRRNYSNEEWYSRFYAQNKTIEIIQNEDPNPNSAIVISPEILTLQNLGGNSLFVCDAFHYNKLDFRKKDFQYYFLCRDGDIDYLRKRYGVDINVKKWSVHSIFENGLMLYKYRR